jgi:hypothetical protein
MRPSIHYLRLMVLIALSGLCLLLAACEVEEELKLNVDGSGTYRVRILVEKEVGEALQEIRKDAQARGFTVVEEGETANRKFVVVARDFKNVSELNDKDDTYALDIEQSSPFKRTYHLSLNFRGNPSASGFSRSMEVSMPATVASTNVGTATGSTVRWDCSHPGTLEVQAAGLVLPLTSNQRKVVLAVLILGALLLVGVRVARWRPPSCRNCGTRIEPNAKFCPKCGTQRDVAPPSGETPGSGSR